MTVENNRSQPRSTRGRGLLEGWLSRKRIALADGLIPPQRREGTVLDLGCGTWPLFLDSVNFREKIGLDRFDGPRPDVGGRSITLINHDLIADQILPFDADRFEAVVMLAVLEHLSPAAAGKITLEAHRVLKPDGLFILTTPAPWADRLLRVMAALRLVSPEEISEHQAYWSPDGLGLLLAAAGFRPEKIRTGLFELGFNVWAAGEK